MTRDRSSSLCSFRRSSERPDLECAARSSRLIRRRALTLIELLIAVSIIAMTAAALASLSRATQISSAYVEGNSTAAQHARVTMERIQRAVQTANASESFPGAVVFAESISGTRFPDTLVVWKAASGTAVSAPNGLPRFSEIVVFCPHPTSPRQLLEITSRSDVRTVPALTSTSQWTTELTSLKTGNTSKKVILTDLVRPARLTSTAAQRGCVRFEALLRPSAAEVSAFRAGTSTWDALSWPQHWYGQTTGMRQTWVRCEIQLMPDSAAGGEVPDSLAIPFLGSAALYYDLVK